MLRISLNSKRSNFDKILQDIIESDTFPYLAAACISKNLNIIDKNKKIGYLRSQLVAGRIYIGSMCYNFHQGLISFDGEVLTICNNKIVARYVSDTSN